ncbi:cytochrome P450 [Schizophyllum amplum]|uniref:Cytochrome P450 n=1 Tax=Schizophyllum amplum TaxID=97359 RepID=A0A550C9Z3_9AGAR|nr:cytochrome P450 [Auriculariopsis ampla]
MFLTFYSSSAALLTSGALVFLSLKWLSSKLRAHRAMSGIPAVGHASLLGSCVSAFEFLLDSPGFIQKGYDTYKGRAFRVPELTHWTVVISGGLVDEFFRLPDKTASLQDAVHEILQADYTLGRAIITNPYHIPLVHVHEELAHVMDHGLHSTTEEWVEIQGFQLLLEAICHASNRIFVGHPLCHNQRFVTICVGYSKEVIKVAAVLNMFPDWIKPLLACCFKVQSYIDEAARLLRPIIEQRYASTRDKGNDYEGKPWLMDKAEASEQDVVGLTRRILTLNFAALHTTTLTSAHALYHIAANPQYADEWTRSAIDRLPRLNSFLKETQRLKGSDAVISLARKTRESLTLSDGTTIPAGTFVAVAGTAVHRDSEHFKDPLAFMPWRYMEQHGGRLGHATSEDLTVTSLTHLAFGHGHTACPGRFLASLEMKLLILHLVENYNIKFAGAGERPPNKWFSVHCVPDPAARLMFRKRKAIVAA